MSSVKFKEGDWVKEKNGTQGMIVIRRMEENMGESGRKVACRYKDPEDSDNEKEELFDEDQLEAL